MVVLESSRHIALLRLGYAVDIWDLAIATVPTSRWLSFQGIKVIVICEHKKIMEIANTTLYDDSLKKAFYDKHA